MSLTRRNDIFSDFFGNASYFEPRANVSQGKSGIALEIELPGFSRSDINIETSSGTLTVSASRPDTRQDYTRREFGTATVKRSWSLPRTIDADRIEATYDSGILTLDLPYKSGTAEQHRKIEIR
jgi:HSP20 family protein